MMAYVYSGMNLEQVQDAADELYSERRLYPENSIINQILVLIANLAARMKEMEKSNDQN